MINARPSQAERRIGVQVVVGPHVVRLLVITHIIYLVGKDLGQLSNSAEKIMASGKCFLILFALNVGVVNS